MTERQRVRGRDGDGSGRSRLRLPVGVETFLRAPYPAALTTVRPDGTLHVAPVRFSWDRIARIARVMTVAGRAKVRNIESGSPGSSDTPPRAALCQVAGIRWITLEGPATISNDPERVADAERRYLERYGHAPPDPAGLVVIEIEVARVSSAFDGGSSLRVRLGR